MKIIYHLCPIDYYQAVSDQPLYLPVDFEREGFIHCTRGAEQVVVVANRYYRGDARPFCVLVINENSLTAQLKNEPAADDLLLLSQFQPVELAVGINGVPANAACSAAIAR
jgi:uncharacterized protein (DUF952 family)